MKKPDLDKRAGVSSKRGLRLAIAFWAPNKVHPASYKVGHHDGYIAGYRAAIRDARKRGKK